MDPIIKPPNRRAPIHYPYWKRGGASSLVFLTVCTAKRKAILARQEIHDLMIRVWRESEDWLVGR